MSITIHKINGRDELFCQYHGQTSQQGCYIEIDCGRETLSASYNAEIGNAIPFNVYHGHEQRFGIPCLVASAANALLEEILPLAERVIAGYESVWNGNNMVAKFDTDAQNAIEEIAGLCNATNRDEENIIQAWEVGQWMDGATYRYDGYVTVDKHTITTLTTDEELSEMADEIEADKPENIAFSDSVGDWLEELRDQCGNPE